MKIKDVNNKIEQDWREINITSVFSMAEAMVKPHSAPDNYLRNKQALANQQEKVSVDKMSL